MNLFNSIFVIVSVAVVSADVPIQLWPNGVIPYKLGKVGDFAKGVGNDFYEAIRQLEANTCLRFVNASSNSVNYVLVRKAITGCYSSRGYNGGNQDIGIGSDCMKFARVAYQLGSLVGLEPEQLRYNRFRYLNIFWNYSEAKIDNINMRRRQYTEKYGVPYDYLSAMHWDWTYMASMSTEFDYPAISPKIMAYTYRIGNVNQFSFFDYKRINMQYDCFGVSKCPCTNCGFYGGYTGQDCKCICPPGFSGANCEIGDFPSSYTCGGSITAKSVSQTFQIETPGYPNRRGGEFCVWEINSPDSTKVQLTFDEFLFNNQTKNVYLDNKCVFEWVEVRESHMSLGKRYCGQDLKGRTITSTSNKLAIMINAQTSHSRLEHPRIPFQEMPLTGGMKATVKIVK